MPEFLTDLLYSTLELILWLAGFFVVFGVLERITPCNPRQPASPRAFLVDAAYLLVMPIFNRIVRTAYMAIGITLFFYGKPEATIFEYMSHGFGPAATLPLWLQAAIVFIVSDIILYWTHRWFHGREMWRFHAIHHSPTHVEWHSTYRFHPINVWLSFTLVDTLMMFLGFSIEAVTLMGTFNMLYSAMVHANLNWTFGPFKYLFASPVFHRWHHTTQEEGMNKNFAPTFPLLDIVFGTFYMPENVLPSHYGITGGTVPESFLGQLAYPFKNR